MLSVAKNWMNTASAIERRVAEGVALVSADLRSKLDQLAATRRFRSLEPWWPGARARCGRGLQRWSPDRGTAAHHSTLRQDPPEIGRSHSTMTGTKFPLAAFSNSGPYLRASLADGPVELLLPNGKRNACVR